MYVISIINGGISTTIHDGRQPDGARTAGGTLKETINAIPSFSFAVYPDNPGYGRFKPMLTTIRVQELRSDEYIFYGRVLSVTTTMDGEGRVSQAVTCEGELAYLCDTIQQEATYMTSVLSSDQLRGILATHNDQADSSKQIEMGNCEMMGLGVLVDTDYCTTWDLLQDLFVNGYGGEIRLRHEGSKRYLDFAQQFGSTGTQDIRLGENLRSISKAEEIGTIVTRLYPLGGRQSGGRRLTVAASSQTMGLPYIDLPDLQKIYGIICGTVIFDDIVGEGPHENNAAVKLYRAAMQYLDGLNASEIVYKVSALDLSTINEDIGTFKLYNSYYISNNVAGISPTLRLTGRTIDIDNPHLSTLTFGTKRQSLNAIVARKR